MQIRISEARCECGLVGKSAETGAMCGFCTSFQQFIVARVLVGLAVGGMVHNSFLLATECVGSSARHVMGTAFNVVWVAGCVAVVAAAYLVPAWRPMLLLFRSDRFLQLPMSRPSCHGKGTRSEKGRAAVLCKCLIALDLQRMCDESHLLRF